MHTNKFIKALTIKYLVHFEFNIVSEDNTDLQAFSYITYNMMSFVMFKQNIMLTEICKSLVCLTENNTYHIFYCDHCILCKQLTEKSNSFRRQRHIFDKRNVPFEDVCIGTHRPKISSHKTNTVDGLQKKTGSIYLHLKKANSLKHVPLAGEL